jgi:hypothetical protein
MSERPGSLGTMVCPECGETAVAFISLFRTAGPFLQWRHEVDGQPLCPVINTGDGVVGYVPATPVPAADGPGEASPHV